MIKVPNQLQKKPLLGILTISDDHGGFKGNKMYFQAISQEAQRQGERVVIIPIHKSTSVDQMDISDGWQWSSSAHQWKKKASLVPSVVYNRIPSRKAESSDLGAYWISQIKQRFKLPLFNPFFFNKWQLYQWLKFSGIEGLRIPFTCRLHNPEDGLMMLKSYERIYLKPVDGKAGIGFFVLNRQGTFFQNESGTKYETLETEQVRWQNIGTVIGQQNYIAQQSIALATNDGRPFDIRVLVQKNRRGQWKMSGVGARVAGSHAISTHVPRGGSIAPARDVLSNAFGANGSALLLKKIEQIAIHCAMHIEQCCRYSLGELSLDLGIDEHMRCWFFEANSKPMTFDEPEIFTTSVKRIIEYAQFLRSASTGSST